MSVYLPYICRQSLNLIFDVIYAISDLLFYLMYTIVSTNSEEWGDGNGTMWEALGGGFVG